MRKKSLALLLVLLMLTACEQMAEIPPELPEEVPEIAVEETPAELPEEVPESNQPSVYWQESDLPAKAENFRVVERVFPERNGKNLSLTMEIPQEWYFEDGNSTIYDEQGRKACASMGILRELQAEESIYTLDNPEELPIVESASVFSIPQGLALQTIGVPPDNGRQNAPAKIYSYDFIVENQIVNLHFYVFEDDPDGEMQAMRALYSLKAEVTPKWEESELTWKYVTFKTSIQDPVKGLSEAQTVDISMMVPDRWILDDEHGVVEIGDFHYGDGTKAAEGFVVNLFEEGETLRSVYEKSLLSQIRIPVEDSPTATTIKGQEVFVDVIYLPPYKGEQQPEPGEEHYCYRYDLPWGSEGYFGVSIYEQGLDFEGDMALHKQILESIAFSGPVPLDEESLNSCQKELISIAESADILGWHISEDMTEEEKGHFLLTMLGSRHVDGEQWEISSGASYAIPLADLNEILAKFTPCSELDPVKAFADQWYDEQTQTLRLDMLGGYGGVRNHGLLALEEKGDRVTVVLGSYDVGFWKEPRVYYLLGKITVEFQLNGEDWRIINITRQ